MAIGRWFRWLATSLDSGTGATFIEYTLAVGALVFLVVVSVLATR